jgi:hypothetical protein
MQARVTQVVPAHHEHARMRDCDQVAILVTVSQGSSPVPSSLTTQPDTLTVGQVVVVEYADPTDPSRGFRII